MGEWHEQAQGWEAYLVGGMEAQGAWDKARAVGVPSLGGEAQLLLLQASKTYPRLKPRHPPVLVRSVF